LNLQWHFRQWISGWDNSSHQFEEIQSKIAKLDKRDDQSQADERVQFNDLIYDVQASLMTLSENGKKRANDIRYSKNK